MARLTDFIRELRRRNLFRVGAAYAVVAWLLIQVASIVLPAFNVPNRFMQLSLIMVVLGLPLALILAWAFEMTPEGMKREQDVVRAESVTGQSARKLNFVIIAVLAVAVVFFALDKFVWETEKSRETTAISGGDRKSIAVLPFENMSGDATNIPFTVGVHDDLLTHLSKISSIRTISRTSVLRYRDTDKTVPEIASELGVATILEGGVQRAGDQVRINVQLIDADTDAHLWGETYNRQLTAASLFAIQSEIATAIAAALRTTLSPEEERYIASVPTESLEALESYQLGRQSLDLRTMKSIAEAIDLFTTAKTIDPNFAQAWAGLADAYQIMAYTSGLNIDELNQKAFDAVDEALRLNDELSETQTALAAILEVKRDYAGAMEAIERALDLDPNSAYARFRYADVLHETGHIEQSLLEWEKAVQLDPLSPIINDAYAWTLAEVGRFDESLARYRRVDEIDPQYPGTAVSIGTIYGLAYGRLDLANLWYRKALGLDPGNPWLATILGLVFLELDDDETAGYWIDRALRQAPEHPWANGAMMMLQSYRGDPEQIRNYAEKVSNVDPQWRLATALSHGHVPDLREGNYKSALDRYASGFPELFQSVPDINAVNYRPAIDIAGLLILTGEDDRAAEMLAACQRRIAETIRVGFHGFWVSDVQILALLGRTDEALAALRQAVDQGWRTDWRYFFYVDPNFDSIRGEQVFQAILREVEDDMAAQLERTREMEANGELVPIPDDGA
jgi:TolB-like protein/Flp pilus assembly protein TadD